MFHKHKKDWRGHIALCIIFSQLILLVSLNLISTLRFLFLHWRNNTVAYYALDFILVKYIKQKKIFRWWKNITTGKKAAKVSLFKNCAKKISKNLLIYAFNSLREKINILIQELIDISRSINRKLIRNRTLPFSWNAKIY